MFWRRQRQDSTADADASTGEEVVETIPTEEPPSPPVEEAPAGTETHRSIETGVERTRRNFVGRLRGVLGGGGLSEEAWEEVEETLIAADVGAELALRVVARARDRARREGPEAAVRNELASLLAPRVSEPWDPGRPGSARPAVVLVVGVNGTGKTTTIAKLAALLHHRGRTVLLGAADTFRAAAIGQLRVWADRVGVPVVAHAAGADPSAVVYDTLDAAIARDIDVVIIDTAGRLHTKSNLMEELAKIRRTIARRLPESEPEVLFVLDATTGQNGLSQARAFHDASGLTGLVVTKLDSTARGGIVFAIESTLDVPVRFVGVGEGVEDLVDFDPRRFVDALFA